MNSVDRAYIAGFFDGEGCITIARKGDLKRVKPVATITQKDPTTLIWIQTLLGCGGLHQRKDNTYVLRFQSTESVQKLIEVIYPYLQLKRSKAKIAYHLAKTIVPRTHKLHKSNGSYQPLSDEVILQRGRLVNRF